MRDGTTTPMSFDSCYPKCRRLVRSASAFLVCALVVALGATRVVRAQETVPHNPPPAALEGYVRGKALYHAGRYREALGELDLALSLDPMSPNLVYNVARLHELLGEFDEATTFYERYRSMLAPTDDEERKRVASIMLRLQGARTEATQEPVGPPTDAARNPRAEEPARGVADAIFWTAAGVAGAALVSGTALGLSALKSEKRVEAFVVGPDGSTARRRGLAQRADRLAVGSDVLVSVGAILAVSSALLYLLREHPAPAERRAERPSVALSAGAHGFGLAVGGPL